MEAGGGEWARAGVSWVGRQWDTVSETARAQSSPYGLYREMGRYHYGLYWEMGRSSYGLYWEMGRYHYDLYWEMGRYHYGLYWEIFL